MHGLADVGQALPKVARQAHEYRYSNPAILCDARFAAPVDPNHLSLKVSQQSVSKASSNCRLQRLNHTIRNIQP
jgi:hypothetical protein